MELTELEEKIATMLGDVFVEYLKLPVEHPMERDEFCRAIHVCQSIVMARPAVRHFKTKGKASN